MGSTSEKSAGDREESPLRINSSGPGTCDDDKVDEVELQDLDRKREEAGGGRRQFPRLGLDALVHESRPSGEPNEDGTYQFYKVYKRRWFGLVQLTLLNIVVSWEWLTFSPVATIAAEFFNTDESAINWISTAFLFAFVVVVPLVIYVLHWGPKPSIVAASVLMLAGSWIRYGGVLAHPHNFGVVMFGQILIGFSQPFVLAAPTRYSDLWLTSRGRVAATALMSLANPFGAALGQLIIPFWVYSPSDIPNAVLYLAIIATVACVPSFFIPAKPPTPPSASGETVKLDLHVSVPRMLGSLEVWLIFIPFVVYVGFFNSISTILNQVMVPYGFTDTDAGIAGAVLIVVGLVSAAITSPILDRTKAFLLAIKIAVPVIGLCYLAFVWMPGTRSDAGPYIVLAILGAASFSLVPVAMEYLVELTHPVSPEVTSTVAWAGGQLLGALFIIISNALRAGPDADPPNNMNKAMIFQAIIAMVAFPVPLFLGLFGRRDKVVLRRILSDQEEGPHGAPAPQE
ncbi:MFS general substrate transporter [Cryphonectria parasitica EP155]|uniref:MFS general substrate transporter n=1 Tax=Cryphonectria parasitica (strain ATCC 38755 / EP155) TaxID=660469 RepID=A0A9P4XUP0_CRYP1|nr:MFS general substrate transporter [Cryphonectria parasitica EP155]KAF3761324.1 MFS general substrate transporter [Cryphonectria parasitica EP155]